MIKVRRPGLLWIVVAIGIVAIAASVLVGRGFVNDQRRDVVRVAIATWPGFASGFVGKERGFFGGLDVEFIKMDESRARHAAYQSGQIDVMISSADVFAQELAQGIKGTIILVTDESVGADGIVAKESIKTPADLRGRKVAFARATPSHYFLYKALDAVGLSPSDIEQVVVEDPGQAGQAYLGGSVDAAVTWEPLLSQVRSAGKGHVLTSTRELRATIVDVLVASPKFAGNKDALAHFLKGWMESVDYIETHKEDATAIIAHGLGISPEDAESAMSGLRFAGPERNQYFLCDDHLQPKLRAILEDAANFWMSQGIIDSYPPLDGSISDAFCKVRKGGRPPM